MVKLGSAALIHGVRQGPKALDLKTDDVARPWTATKFNPTTHRHGAAREHLTGPDGLVGCGVRQRIGVVELRLLGSGSGPHLVVH